MIALLERLRVAGVTLEVGDGDKLRAKGAEGAITPELRAAIAAHKAELLEALRAPVAAREERRRQVLAMLERDPGIRYGWLTDDKCHREHVIVALAIRDIGTCELSIERPRYDAFKLLEIIGRSTAS